MARILKVLLWVSGIASAVVFAVPTLVVIAALALILPGLVLAMMPNVFLYTGLFSLSWFGLRRAGPAVAAAVGIALAGAVAVAWPELADKVALDRLAEATRRDREPPARIARAATVRLAAMSSGQEPHGCNDLCLLLLINGAADRIVVTAPAASGRRGEPAQPPGFLVFRFEHGATCQASAEIAQNHHRTGWTGRAREIAEAARLREAAGDCLMADREAAPKADLLIRRVNEEVGETPPRLVPWAGAVKVEALEAERDGTILARVSVRKLGLLSRPLHLEPYGYGMELTGWEWGRRIRTEGRLDVLDALGRWTSLRLDVPTATAGPDLRREIDEALADPARPATDAAFRLVPDLYEGIRKTGLEATDRARLLRLVADRRVTSFWFFPVAVLKEPGGADRMRGAILDRLPELAGSRVEDTFKALEQLVRFLPDGSFREADPRVEALLAGPETRYRVPNLVGRLADRGAAVSGRLVEIMRDAWSVRNQRSRDRPAQFGQAAETASAALTTLCRIAPGTTGTLPQLRALAEAGEVPPPVAEGDLWRITLVRLGADPQEFSLPPNRSGSQDRYRARLAKADCGR